MLVVLLVLRTQYTDESLWRSWWWRVPVLVCQINAAVRKHDTVLYV